MWSAHLQADAVTITKRHVIDDRFHTLGEIAVPINESRAAIPIDDLQITKGKFIAVKPQRVAWSACLIGLIAVQGSVLNAKARKSACAACTKCSREIDTACLC